MHAQDHHRRVRALGHNSAGSFNAIHDRHREVHDHHVRRVLFGQANGLAAVLSRLFDNHLQCMEEVVRCGTRSNEAFTAARYERG